MGFLNNLEIIYPFWRSSYAAEQQVWTIESLSNYSLLFGQSSERRETFELYFRMMVFYRSKLMRVYIYIYIYLGLVSFS